MFEAEIAVVFGTNLPTLVFQRVAPVENPRQTQGWQALLYVTHRRGLTPRTTCVVNAEPGPVFCRDFAERNAQGWMKLAKAVDAFACWKGSIELGGILEFEFRSTHFAPFVGIIRIRF